VLGLLLVSTFTATTPSPAEAATTFLVPNLYETEVARSISGPTAMAFSPDGRLFVSQQNGKIIVIKNGSKLATPFHTLNVSAGGTQGLLGLTFDPQFATNGYVYVHYTATSPTVHNRVSRLVANGDVSTGTETVLFDLPTLAAKEINHDGGDLLFGNDGKLYVSVGDNSRSQNGQDMSTLFGKILRINSDGAIPADNPFYTSASGQNRAIYALGVRNPFKMTKQPGTGRILFADVGNALWEEVNELRRGGNFGWSLSEGPTSTSGHTTPLFAYSHTTGDPTGCSVTGITFYNPPAATFPSAYVGDVFVADYCQGWIGVLDASSGANTYTKLAAGPKPVDLETGPDGALYYLERGNSGRVMKVSHTGAAIPSISAEPQDLVADVGSSATFSVEAAGSGTLTYQWLRDDVAIPGATSPSYTLDNVQSSDSGVLFRARISNAAGSVLSDEALLTVVVPSEAPTATISAPLVTDRYTGGQVVSFAGSGSDPEDGVLPGTAMTWQVDFHHDDHLHPFILPFDGTTGGQFTVPTVGETSANVWYRITLSVTDSGGQTSSTYRDIHPITTQLAITSEPVGLRVDLDGQPGVSPISTSAVVNVERSVEAPLEQTSQGRRYRFDSWSDGGPRARTFTVPVDGVNLVADYVDVGAASDRVTSGLSALYEFPGGAGTIVPDAVGDLDLTIVDPSKSTWVPDGLLLNGTLLTGGPASQITQASKATNELTIEAWVTPAAVPTQPGFVCLIGDDTSKWSASLTHGYFANNPADRWETRVRTSTRYTNRAYGSGGSVASSLTHLVATRSSSGAIRLFVNGRRVGQAASTGSLSVWPDDFPLSVGGAPSGNGYFNGTINLVAIYARALTDAEIIANRDAGPAGAPAIAPPGIVRQPEDITVTPGSRATFTVEATGAQPLSYVWSRNGIPLPGEDRPTLTLTNPSPIDDGARFTVTVSNDAGSLSSRSAVLHVETSTRISDGLQALYDFSEGSGTSARDSSGVGAPLDLNVVGTGYEWVDDGIALSGARFQSSGAATKITNAVRATNEYTIEAWVSPDSARPTQPGWIAGVARDPNVRNSVLSQGFWGNAPTNVIEHRMRSSGAYSARVASSPVIADQPVHIVVTRLANGYYRLYTNGVRRSVNASPGTLTWDTTLPVVIGADANGDYGFDGVVDLVAFYSRALTDDEVVQNYEAG
jgi:glucose/arabinose dehydrogenase